MRKTAAAYLILGLLTTPAAAGVIILSRDPTLSARAPKDAWDGPGCWADSDRYFVTGHSTSLDSLGEAKGDRYERDFAEQDAKRRLAVKIAQEKDPQFTEDSYDLDVEMSGFQTVATYRLQGQDGLFLIGMVKRDDAVVHASFNVEKTRTRGRAAFKVGDFVRAARLFAALTQHGAQDGETVKYARAASAHLNLAAGVTKATRLEALHDLAAFYDGQGDAEMALQFEYQIYRELESPDRALLERLARLCAVTHRDDNAADFRNEIERRWPPDAH
jgi:hypothetical protein